MRPEQIRAVALEHFQRGNYPEAEVVLRSLVARLEKSVGLAHPDVATALNILAQVLRVTSRLGEAEQMTRQALAIYERSVGPDHPDVAGALNNLAQLLQFTRRLGEAEPLMRRALAILEKSLGTDDPNVATALNNLATLYFQTNRLAEAEPLMRRHLEIFLKFTYVSGHQHPHLQEAIENYTTLLFRMGRSQLEVLAKLNAISKPFGIQFG